MPARTRESDAAAPPRKRDRISMPLSIALHAAVLALVGLVPWAASEIPAPSRAPQRVVWLDHALPPRSAPAPTEIALPDPARVEPIAATAAIVPPALRESPLLEPTVGGEPARIEPKPAEPEAETPPIERPENAPTLPEPPPRTASEPPAASPESEEPPATLPDVDWEKERLNAARDVLDERARRGEYLTFSPDDLVEEKPEPLEPVRPPLVVDNCVIVKNRLQRFAALMTGRCVREARGDLFASIKPAYLKAHPVCIETRPENPGSFLSDGRRISTVKCQLVADEEVADAEE